MKRSAQVISTAALIAYASAQGGTTTNYIPICPTATSITITLPATVTLCPGPNCNGGVAGPMITPGPTMMPGDPGHLVGQYTSIGADGSTTVLGIWETVFSSMGASGLVPATYTITQPCPCESTAHPSVMPSGFVTTVVSCSVCQSGPTTVTLTQPCPTGPYAQQTGNVAPTQGTPTPNNGVQASAGTSAAASAGSNGPNAQASAGNSPASAAPAGSISAAKASSNAMASTGSVGAGKAAPAMGTTGPVSPAVGSMNNMTNAVSTSMSKASGSITPYTGTAGHIEIASTFMAIGLAAAAFLL